jgi:hypothetical protein
MFFSKSINKQVSLFQILLRVGTLLQETYGRDMVTMIHACGSSLNKQILILWLNLHERYY